MRFFFVLLVACATDQFVGSDGAILSDSSDSSSDSMTMMDATKDVQPTGIYFVGVQDRETSGAHMDLSIAVPQGTQPGDLMIAFVGKEMSAVSVVAIESGWQNAELTVHPSGGTLQSWWRIAQNEPSNYTWTTAASDQMAGAILVYRNADSLYGATSGISSTTMNTVPSVIIMQNGDWIVTWIYGIDGSAFSVPASMNPRLDIPPMLMRDNIAAADEFRATGMSPPRTWNMNQGGRTIAQGVAIKRR